MEASALLSIADGLRADGRTATQLRPIVCRRSSLSRSDGSATWTSGGTTVVASVFGPRAAASSRGGGGGGGAAGGDADADAAAAVSVEWRGPGGVGASAAAAAATSFPSPSAAAAPAAPLSAAAAASFVRSCVQASLEQRELPARSAVAVFVHVLSADGGELAAAANAVSAALSDAAMPLRFSFAAATVSVAAAAAAGGGGGAGDGRGAGASPPPPPLLLLDPTSLEEASCLATATVAFPCASRRPGAGPLVDPGGVLAVRCLSRVAVAGGGGGGAAAGGAGAGAGAGGVGGGKSPPPSSSPSGFGADPECSLLAVAIDAAAKGAQRVAEFGRMSLEASLGGGGGGVGA